MYTDVNRQCNQFKAELAQQVVQPNVAGTNRWCKLLTAVAKA